MQLIEAIMAEQAKGRRVEFPPTGVPGLFAVRIVGTIGLSAYRPVSVDMLNAGRADIIHELGLAAERLTEAEEEQEEIRLHAEKVNERTVIEARAEDARNSDV